MIGYFRYVEDILIIYDKNKTYLATMMTGSTQYTPQ
jgi:hypothetical protein